MKYLLYGIGLAALGIIATLILWGSFERAYLMTGSIGLVCIGWSVIASGSLSSFGSLGSEDRINEDRMRANFANESAEDRNIRFKISINSLLLGLPSILIAAIIYFVVI
ncbi:DUF5316 family protein [Priestia megaterium]